MDEDLMRCTQCGSCLDERNRWHDVHQATAYPHRVCIRTNFTFFTNGTSKMGKNGNNMTPV